MPYWCENKLDVIGELVDIEKFIEKVCVPAEYEGYTLDFNKIIPYPEKYALMDKISAEWESNNPNGDWSKKPKDGFNSGSYDWCCDNWGTKWNARRGYSIDYGDGVLRLDFFTAWCPPDPILEKLVEMFPELEFEYRFFEEDDESSGGFRGAEGKINRQWNDRWKS